MQWSPINTNTITLVVVAVIVTLPEGSGGQEGGWRWHSDWRPLLQVLCEWGVFMTRQVAEQTDVTSFHLFTAAIN